MGGGSDKGGRVGSSSSKGGGWGVAVTRVGGGSNKGGGCEGDTELRPLI